MHVLYTARNGAGVLELHEGRRDARAWDPHMHVVGRVCVGAWIWARAVDARAASGASGRGVVGSCSERRCSGDSGYTGLSDLSVLVVRAFLGRWMRGRGVMGRGGRVESMRRTRRGRKRGRAWRHWCLYSFPRCGKSEGGGSGDGAPRPCGHARRARLCRVWVKLDEQQQREREERAWRARGVEGARARADVRTRTRRLRRTDAASGISGKFLGLKSPLRNKSRALWVGIGQSWFWVQAMPEPNARFRFGVRAEVPRTRTEPNLASTGPGISPWRGVPLWWLCWRVPAGGWGILARSQTTRKLHRRSMLAQIPLPKSSLYTKGQPVQVRSNILKLCLHLHARRDTVVHVDATVVHGTVQHRALPCTTVLADSSPILIATAKEISLAIKNFDRLGVSARLTTVVFVILQGFLRHMVHHGVQYFAAPAATAAPALLRDFDSTGIFFLPPSSRWRPTSIPGSITGYMQSSSSQLYPAHSAAVYFVGKDMADNWEAVKHST
ncbi:hypothetical protein B0H16DRAFT_1457494 [Mycena metata]|uniref:Uncharacterized protein n=1 Tax=Mycena metata TaxID=1033252 RepID=A0AAD7J7P4_9AGAR|nr:hypothetical protein B0H16DRAFT_1457494 [Mycena metata]